MLLGGSFWASGEFVNRDDLERGFETFRAESGLRRGQPLVKDLACSLDKGLGLGWGRGCSTGFNPPNCKLSTLLIESSDTEVACSSNACDLLPIASLWVDLGGPSKGAIDDKLRVPCGRFNASLGLGVGNEVKSTDV